jgi:magnesium chelatase family protein
VKFQDIAGDRAGESSAEIRARVIEARHRQQRRFGPRRDINCNARMESRDVRRHCVVDDHIRELLRHAMQDLGLSARAYDRILKVSRTIADLAGAEALSADHVLESIQMRSLDRQIWG